MACATVSTPLSKERQQSPKTSAGTKAMTIINPYRHPDGPQTSSEWQQLDAIRHRTYRLKFRWILLYSLLLIGACKFWLFPRWDEQLRFMESTRKQQEMQSCSDSGGSFVEGNCIALRKRN